MSLTSGFFNSLNGDRKYSADQLSQLFDGIFSDGVFETIGQCFLVRASSGNTVQVAPGRAWFNHTWTYNSTIMLLDATDSDLLLPRIDAVVLEVNHEDTVRTNRIIFVEGTAATEPTKPTLTHTSLVDQYPLAYVYRPTGSNEITTANITNVVGTSECPFAVALLEKSVTIDDLLAQWDAEFSDWRASEETDWNNWSNAEKLIIEDFAAQIKAIIEQSGAILIDKDLDWDSVNAVQNKVVTKAIGKTLTGTLVALDTEVSFTDDLISDSATIDIYTEKYGVSPSKATIEGHTLTLLFAVRDDDLGVKVVIK